LRRPLLLVAAGLAATALTATGLPAATAAPGHGHGHGHKRVCTSTPAVGTAACTAEVRTKDDSATPDATTTYASGYSPVQLQKAYNVPTPAGVPTIAIVDAYANPNAQSDLNTYRTRFGLGAKTIAQYRQNNTVISSRNKPAASTGWGQEESLDLDMASAICPACNLVYVGANSSGFTDLVAAENVAHKHATVVSNSYGGSEFSGETSSAYSAAYNVPGHISTISSGDDSYGVEFPAALNGQYVVSVGGTSLQLNSDGTRASETVWSGAGSGCSAYVSKPTWQTDPGCAKRTVADVSAVADPATGVAVYDSYGSTNKANWYVFGGTSVAAPIVGAYYAAAGIPAGGVADTYAASANGSANLFDVTSGSNGACSPSYLCTGTPGYDGPSGLGTPNGITGF
jgi:subtilase family serine protease